MKISLPVENLQSLHMTRVSIALTGADRGDDLHGVEGHHHCGDQHKRHGDVGHDVGCRGGLRVFYQIPDTFLVPGVQSSSG